MTKNIKKQVNIVNKSGPAGGFYCLGFVGSAIHFVSSVDGFWNIILALLKAAVWPAFLINRVFELLRI